MTRHGVDGARISRRNFARRTATLLAAAAAGACDADHAPNARRGRIDAAPSATSTRLAPGMHRIEISHRGAVLQLPSGAVDRPLPLLVLFHGAGGSADGVLRLLNANVVSSQAAILATNAEGTTWDALTPQTQTVLEIFDVFGDRRLRGFGPDVASLDAALTDVFRDVAIDPQRVSIGGFSDGATYALALGLRNGELFRRVVAFSPGFILDGERHGRPGVFISHGRRDNVLPIDLSSRRIAPALQQQGYAVTVREFDGGHEVPEQIAREALEWAIAR